MIATSKQTPLYQTHQDLGGRIIDFAGWSMPVQYESILQEHHAVRNAAGLFDISHMGNFLVSGPAAASWLDSLLTNRISKLEPGQGQYTLMLNEEGGVIDDLILYRVGDTSFYLVVNAALIETDLSWLKQHEIDGVTLVDQSDETAAVALQGPKAEEILLTAFPSPDAPPARNRIVTREWESISLQIARTGYTGEDGFEIFFPASDAVRLWKHLLEKGQSAGLKPAGLGARDTLRLEACLPLNGNDLLPTVSPVEAGLTYFVDLDKPAPFIGSDKLKTQADQGPPRKLMAFSLTQSGAPPRPHYPVYIGENRIGEVTSGGLAPTLKKGIGLALVDATFAQIGQAIEIEIRGKRLSAVLEKKPLYRKI